MCAKTMGYLQSVDAVGEVQLGRQRSPKNHQGSHMRPYLRAANVTWNGIDFCDIKEMNFAPEELKRYKLIKGDILLNEASGSADEVGKPTIWGEEIEDCCFQNTLLRVRPSNLIDRKYLWLIFLHAARNGGFASAARGVNILHLGKANLASWPVRFLRLTSRAASLLKSEGSSLLLMQQAGSSIQRWRVPRPFGRQCCKRRWPVDWFPGIWGKSRVRSFSNVSNHMSFLHERRAMRSSADSGATATPCAMTGSPTATTWSS